MIQRNILLTFALALVLLATSWSTAAGAGDVPSLSLRSLIQTGTAGEFYTLSDALTGVYVSPLFKNVLWAKDDNRYLNKSVPTVDQIASHHLYDAYDATQGVTEMDQSNWVKIVFPSGYDATPFVGHRITNVSGRVNMASTPTGPVGLYIDVEAYLTQYDSKGYPVVGEAVTDYATVCNAYCPAHFVKQDTWFLVKPKNLEYAKLQYAVWGADGKFHVPARKQLVGGTWQNGHNLAGSVAVDMRLWEGNTWDGTMLTVTDPNDVFNVRWAYDVAVIVEFSTGSKVSLDIDPGFDGDFNYAPSREDEGFDSGDNGVLPDGYTNVAVYPLRLLSPGISTGVDAVTATKTVAGTHYYNLQGAESNGPHRGFNLVVTTYTDGSTSTAKMMK